MPLRKAEKPATALHGEPASNVDLLGGGVDLTNSIFPSPSQVASRRLIGARVFAEISPGAAPTDPEDLISALLARGVTVARVVKAVAP
jgi:hypothetical protein